MHSAKSEGGGRGETGERVRVSFGDAEWRARGRAAARAMVNVAGKRDVGTSR